ncbi:M16 family metallopeptidase [Abyssisolibacter fermentans]|uniref:M16 family metallopeptidase n=1 Tax=Abyssisolibacter fermentans TaxID=1766203 RepID=UPI0008379951|nr:pitrilysin family protein [Abyssisolibacter fermentans]
MYNKITLKNGLRVVIEEIPHVRSVTIGLWVKAGSVNEKENNNGVSHFIEHMLFKGTKNRTAKELAEVIDNIGGQINAFTSKECTCFYAKVLDEHFETAVDVLSDMIFNSNFDEDDIEKEKKVVIEEINMYEDTPEEIAHDLISKAIFNNHSLGFPILGHADTLLNMDRSEIMRYFNEHYIPNNTVVSIAGNVKTQEAIDLIEKYFKNWSYSDNIIKEHVAPEIESNFLYKSKETEQLHLCMGMQGIPASSKYYYSLMVLNNILGGSMSSRLFQKIREEKGLAYSIYSYPLLYSNAGAFIIYAGINPQYIVDVVDMILAEVNKIKKNCINENLLQRSKEQLKGNYIIGLESTSSRMISLGKSELLLNKIVPPVEGLEKIDKITLEDIEQIIEILFYEEKLNIAYVGKVNEKDEVNKKFNSLVSLKQEA